MANVVRARSVAARPVHLRPTRAPRRLALALASASALMLAALLGAAPAGALVSEVSGTKVGLQPREMGRWWDGGANPGAPSVNSPGAGPCEAPWLAPCAGSAFHAGAAAKPVPVPRVAAAVASHSLRRVVRHGLVVRYSVSERVAGHFEVLLPTSLAHRLRLHGPGASGLAAGTPLQTVIGKALLVTAAGGRNTVTIQFGKTTAARLARLHGVSLMLRLVVRNASSGSAAVVTTVRLSR